MDDNRNESTASFDLRSIEKRSSDVGKRSEETRGASCDSPQAPLGSWHQAVCVWKRRMVECVLRRAICRTMDDVLRRVTFGAFGAGSPEMLLRAA